MGIGYKLKELRKNKKLTQKQLAELVGLSEMSIRRYENDVNEPTIEILSKIAYALETQLDNILIADPNSQLYKATSSINNLKADAEKQAEIYKSNLEIDIAFLTLCEHCGFKIGIETDDDISYFGDHIISYKDKNDNEVKFAINSDDYKRLFRTVCNSIKKEILNSQFYDFIDE